MNEPFSIDELGRLGFRVLKKTGRTTAGQFDQCFVEPTLLTYEESELVGTFYSPPSLAEIIRRVAENAKNKEYWRIKEQLAVKLLDAVDI